MSDPRDTFSARLCLPLIIAPMFLISGPELVIAAAKSGVMGAMPAPNARTIDDLRNWFEQITAALDAVGRNGMWAINMIVHKSYDRFDAELDLICEFKPGLVVTALGSPKRPLERVHSYGGSVYCDVISPDQARKAVDAGADGLVLVAAGAGGHTGRYSPLALVEEVRSFWSGPVVLGGAIGGARAMQAALTLGADLAYMGTRFIACRESMASDAYRDMLIRTEMVNIVTTAAVTGVQANWIRESLDLAGFNEDMLKIEKKIDFSNIHADTKAWKNIWGAGHGVGRTTEIQSVDDIVRELQNEYWVTSAEAATMLRQWPKLLETVAHIASS